MLNGTTTRSPFETAVTSGPGLLDDAHRLVAEHVAGVEVRRHHLVEVEVRAAHAGGGDPDDHVVGLADARVGNLVDPDIALALPGECLHYARRLLVDPGLEHAAGGDLRQERVGLRLLVERLVHQVLDPVEAAVVGKLPRGSVGRDLVVLDPLGSGDQRGVGSHRVAAHLDRLLALGDESLHPLADLGRVRDSELAERLLDAVQVPARLLEMVLEGLAKRVVMRRHRHLR